ncbi:MAG: Flp pilus assembly complex ATPase component TadA [Candidatus Sumerlaeaceae bacterium]|nr:Flp pilus assembly complex ATPase component TadA [Candidatus Sumerlaeaceae bacterium]
MAVRKPTEEERKFFEKTAAAKRSGPTSGKALGQILEEAGILSQDMLRDLIPDDESAATLRHNVVNAGLARDEDILSALAASLGYEQINLRDLKVTKELVELIDVKHAIKYRVFPVRSDDENLWVAMADPLNIQTTDDLQRIYRKQVHPVVANEEDINRFIKHYYEGSDISDLYQSAADEAVAAESKESDDDYTDIDLTGDAAINQPPVVKFVDLIFKQAVHDRASDIHVEPNKSGITIRFRIDGVLHEVPAPPKRWQNSIISRLKVLSGMDLAEKRIPLDGRIKLNIPDKKLDVRVSSLPTVFGESIVMRILDQASVLMGLEDVGFLPDTVRIFKELIKSPNGVILMTGPTGSGKTTTLYSALSTINNSETKIITVEDPVEYMLDGVNQVHVNKEIGLDFALALRSMLRQSPDVIMVGEMRDVETAEIGIRAALTGHLVFSTLHTNDAPSACIRLVDMGLKPFLIASSLQAVIAQRLVRRICNHCKQPYKPNEEEIAACGLTAEEAAQKTFFKGKGCDRCNSSGYRGRTAIHEIFVNDPELRHMIIRVESASKLKKAAIKKGMRSLRMDGIEKVYLGQTTAAEIIRITAEDAG